MKAQILPNRIKAKMLVEAWNLLGRIMCRSKDIALRAEEYSQQAKVQEQDFGLEYPKSFD